MKSKLISKIKREIAKLPRTKSSQEELEFLARYLGSNKKYPGIKTGHLVQVANEFLKENKDIEATELAEIIGNLILSGSYEEHIVGGKIFTFLKSEERQKIPFFELKRWLKKAQGWWEVDVICQSSYTGKEVQENFFKWKEAIRDFSKSNSISHRRASLVLQAKSNREIGDDKMVKLALETVETLKHERDILITKAISWLLREMCRHNKELIHKYLQLNKDTLPAIAYRETMKKITTGKK